MEIFFQISWRRDFFSGDDFCTSTTVANGNLIGRGSLTCQYGCSGTVSSLVYKCTDFSISDNWSFGENRVFYNFTSEQVLTIGYSGCCWINPFDSRSWNISTTFSTLPRTDTGIINSTPRAITSPLIRVQEGCNHTITIPVTDPDNDIVKCRWAMSSECARFCDGTGIPGAVLDSDTCTIRYQASDGTGYKAVALMIEDFTASSRCPLSSVALQFIVYVFNSSQPCSASPMFIPSTIEEDACTAVPPGETFHTQIKANSSSSNTSISEIQTFSPSGMIKGNLNQIVGSNTYYVNMSWTPDDEQQNQIHLFCYNAANSDGSASIQTCIKLYAGISSPQPLNMSLSPNKKVVHPLETTWSINFHKVIHRPSSPANISFIRKDTDRAVYMIDASVSDEVTFEHPYKLLITPSYSFEEKHEFYIKFEQDVVESFEGCQSAGNEAIMDKNFWTFVTLDVTPPVIHAQFTIQPSISNYGNVSFTWDSNEAVTWQCNMTHDLMEVNVNCSGGTWTGYYLSEGKYMLQIEATDEANNKAIRSHDFSINFLINETPPYLCSKPIVPVTSTGTSTLYNRTGTSSFTVLPKCTASGMYYTCIQNKQIINF